MSIDPKQIALPDGLRPESAPTKEKVVDKASRKRITGRFLRGPIPLEWLMKASQLSGQALHVAIAIWFLTGVKNTNSVQLSNKLLSEFGVNRYSKRRALRQLISADLISVEQGRGKSPVVTVLECSDVC
ncbi:hypothetical protein XMV242_000845 [Marinobacterium sp. xm-v-242]|nr:hypothetical protein [Marinobacterium sp. xm-v-242]NRP76967.1 hypothetical protein [Marinobacterium sp. xm-m-383]